MLRFEMDVAAADLTARTVEGILVPYGEVAEIAGQRFRFLPGSVTMARGRTPLLVDHERGRPVGVLAELVPSALGELGRFRIDQTPEGDTALVQAASGSRGALSIGANVEAQDRDGILEVNAAEVVEVSLVALGAFDGATVTRVAARADDPEPSLRAAPQSVSGATVNAPGRRSLQLDDNGGTETDDAPAEGEGEDAPEPNPEQMEIADDDDDDGSPTADPAPPDPERMEVMTESQAPAPVILAERSPATARQHSAGELVELFIRAQHGESEARRYIEAALTESISTDVAGLLPPQYERDVLGGKETPRPLYNTFRSRALPGVGLAVNKPKWTTRPDGAWAANVDADATSTKVVIGSQAANVERWDWAGAIPWVVVQRSDPSIIDEIYAEAVQDFYLDVETKIAAKLTAATTDLSDSLGEGIAAFFAANKTSPEVIIVAPDVWGKMADAAQLNQPVAAGEASASGELSSTFAGIRIICSASLAAGSRYLVTRRAIDARVTEPVRLTANAIGALNVELAVVGEGLFDTDYPTEILELTAAP